MAHGACTKLVTKCSECLVKKQKISILNQRYEVLCPALAIMNRLVIKETLCHDQTNSLTVDFRQIDSLQFSLKGRV